MAIAWSKDKVGRGVGDLIVRDPVVLTATLPRFLLNGDRASMHLDLDNVEGPTGDYAIAVRSEGARCRRRGRTADRPAQRPAAERRQHPADRIRHRHREYDRAYQRPRRFCDRAQLCAGRQTGDANSCAPDRQAIGEGREPDVVERSVRRPRTRHRTRRAVGRTVERARCRGAAGGARPLSVRLLGADCQPGIAAALRQRSGVSGAPGVRHRGRSARSRVDRPAARASGLERLVRPVVGGRRRRLARCLCRRFPDARAGEEFPGRRRCVQARARTAAQLRRQCAGSGQGRRAQSCLCALRAGSQWRSADRRPALLRRHQARCLRDSDRQGAARRRAGDARRPRARGTHLRGRAGRAHAAAGTERRPQRLRFGAARRGCARDAGIGKRRPELPRSRMPCSGWRRRVAGRRSRRRRRTPGW